MQKRNLTVALLFIGATGLVGLSHAASTAVPAAPAQSSVKLADAPAVPAPAADEMPEIQHLRAARKHLNEAKDAFDKDPADHDNDRKVIIEGIDKALNAVDAEINELKK